MAMIQWNARERVWLALVLGLAAAWVTDRVIVTGWRDRAVSGRRQVAEAELALMVDEQTARRKDRIRSEYQQYAPYLLGALPEREIVAQFLKELERVAQEAGVTIVSLTPDRQAAPRQDSTVYTAQFKGEATLEQCVGLLAKVQQSRLLMTCDQLTLAPKDAAASALRMEMVVSLAVPSQGSLVEPSGVLRNAS